MMTDAIAAAQPVGVIVRMPGSASPIEPVQGRTKESDSSLQVTRGPKRRKLQSPARVYKRSGLLQPKHKRRIIGGLAVVAVAGGALLAWRLIWKKGEGAVEYETAVAERGSLSAQVTATGTLSPVVTVQVGSQVSGPHPGARGRLQLAGSRRAR